MKLLKENHKKRREDGLEVTSLDTGLRRYDERGGTACRAPKEPLFIPLPLAPSHQGREKYIELDTRYDKRGGRYDDMGGDDRKK